MLRMVIAGTKEEIRRWIKRQERLTGRKINYVMTEGRILLLHTGRNKRKLPADTDSKKDEAGIRKGQRVIHQTQQSLQQRLPDQTN